MLPVYQVYGRASRFINFPVGWGRGGAQQQQFRIYGLGYPESGAYVTWVPPIKTDDAKLSVSWVILPGPGGDFVVV